MASADYSVGTKVTADVSNFEKGMNKAEKALKDFSNKLADNINRLGKKGLIGSIANVTLAMQGLTQSFNTVIKFAKNVSKAINECTEAYKQQTIAERALDTAIANNPFISGASSKALKEFASEMQKVSNYGDEELIPMMTNLVSLGRTESETMQIMSVAMDMSAGMGISLDSAITQLNATLNGNIGRLGQQNAELKDLTEVELRSGKAIEILGEKFKGLSGATADTSKQLQNIKGDFKEALGQFTLPSSDMWNKFWAGFYEKGIEVINKINAFMDAQIIGRKVANTITEQISKIPESNIAGRADYVRKAIKVLTDEELRALGSYLEGSSGYLDIILDQSRKTREEVIAQEEAVNNIANSLTNKIGKEQFSILRNVGQEMENRRIMVKVAKQEAEDKKKQADAEAQITAELQKQEEIASKKTDWASKLLDQRIEMLETERDRAMQYAEEEGEETYTIWRDYNNKILELKLERLEKEKALEEEGLTAEDKIKIEEYYSGETKKIYDELGNYKKKKGKKEEADEKSKFAVMLKVAQDYAKNIGKVFKKVGETIGKTFSAIGSFVKNTFSGLKNIFSKLFDFNVSDALDSLLAVEDAILTFFVETLPKLPSFFESAFSSVLVLINTLVSAIDWEKVKDVVSSMVETFVKYAPDIVSGIVDLFTGIADAVSNVLVENAPKIVTALGDMFFSILDAIPSLITNFLDVAGTYLSEIGKFFTDNAEKLSDDLTEIVSSIIDGISNFITGGGWKNLLNGILAIQNAIQNAIMDNLDAIVDAIIEALPELIQFITDSIVSASKAMEKILKPMIKLILALVEAIIDVLLSDEVLDAGIEAGFTIMDTIFEELVPKLAYLIPKLITKIIGFIIKNIPKIVVAMVKGIVKSFVSFPWVQSIKEMFQGFIDGIKDFFGIHSPSTLFESFGEFMIQGLWNGISNLGQWLWDNVVGFFSNLWEGITNVFANVGDWFSDTFSTAKEGMTNVFENIGNWAVDVWENIKDGFSTVGEWFSDVFKGARAGISSAFDKVGDWASDRWNDIKSGFSNVGEWFKSVFSTAWTNAKAGFSKVGDWASGVWANVKSGFSNVGDWFKTTFTTGWTKAKEGFTKVKDWASGVWANVKSGFSGVGDWFKSTFSTAWTNIKSAWSGVGNWFKGIADGIKSNFSNCVDNMKTAFSKAGSWVKDMASKIGSGLSKAGEAIKDGASWVGNKIKDFFGFATGTQQAPSGLALVGEAGPELVRFRGGEQVLNARNTQKALEGMGNGRTNNFNVTFNNLQDTSAFAMMNQLKQYNRQMAINGIF